MGGLRVSRDRLILVRHGESTWNAEERLQGQLDPPLSERGREQSRALAGMVDGAAGRPRGLQRPGRARQTAELLGLSPGRLDPRWREIDVGSWGGRAAAEVDAQGSEPTNWRGGPRKAADGESWDDSRPGWRARRRPGAAGGPWMVVCHGGCIRVAAAHVTGADALRLGSRRTPARPCSSWVPGRGCSCTARCPMVGCRRACTERTSRSLRWSRRAGRGAIGRRCSPSGHETDDPTGLATPKTATDPECRSAGTCRAVRAHRDGVGKAIILVDVETAATSGDPRSAFGAEAGPDARRPRSPSAVLPAAPADEDWPG